MKHWVLRAICVLTSLTVPLFEIAAAEFVVIGSTDADLFGTGTVIKSEEIIDVPKGQSVTLMDGTGKIMTIRGPYSATPEGPSGGEDRNLIALVSDMFAEMALLFLVTGPLVAGAGLGAAAWSSVVGPLVWGNVITGASSWSNVEGTVAEVLGMQALAWGPILAVVLLARADAGHVHRGDV